MAHFTQITLEIQQNGKLSIGKLEMCTKQRKKQPPSSLDAAYGQYENEILLLVFPTRYCGPDPLGPPEAGSGTESRHMGFIFRDAMTLMVALRDETCFRNSTIQPTEMGINGVCQNLGNVTLELTSQP